MSEQKTFAPPSLPEPGLEEVRLETSTQQDEVDVLQRRRRRLYIFSRPKVLQYTYKGQVIRAGVTSDLSDGDHTVQDIDEDLARSRDRLDLFIDLIWVGIVGNISEAFSSAAYGTREGRVSESDAFGLFVLVFLPSWRIWNGVREILNNYYRDDVLQRLYLILLLTLSVFYGNNLAYTTEKPGWAKVTSIAIYLFIRASLLICEVIYAFFIPWLRRIVLLTVLLYLPSIGLWVTAIYVRGRNAEAPIIAAIIMDYTVPIVLELSIIRKTFFAGYGKALDPNHFTSRMESFFIITVGEGVLQLVKDGPLGLGVTQAASYSFWGLLIYFLLTVLYFNRDSSRQFVPAVVTKGWRTWLWITCHIPIFMSVLTLSAGIMYTVRETAAQLDIETTDTTTEKPRSPEETARMTNTALWTIAISLATTVLSMTCMALLDQPRDTENRMRINNRYIRLATRPVYAVIILCVPVTKDLRPEIFMGICGLGMSFVTSWEYIACTERGNKFIEPKRAME